MQLQLLQLHIQEGDSCQWLIKWKSCRNAALYSNLCLKPGTRPLMLKLRSFRPSSEACCCVTLVKARGIRSALANSHVPVLLLADAYVHTYMCVSVWVCVGGWVGCELPQVPQQTYTDVNSNAKAVERHGFGGLGGVGGPLLCKHRQKVYHW